MWIFLEHSIVYTVLLLYHYDDKQRRHDGRAVGLFVFLVPPQAFQGRLLIAIGSSDFVNADWPCLSKDFTISYLPSELRRAGEEGESEEEEEEEGEKQLTQ